MWEEIYNESYQYIFSKSDAGYKLEVACGTSAIFMVSIMLTEAEEAQYQLEGKSFIEDLSRRVYGSPASFNSRRL